MGRRIAALVGVMTCLALTVVGPIAAPAAADTGSSAVTVKKTFTDGKGASHTVSFSVSQSTNLLARQNVLVGWNGAVATHNYSVVTNPALNNNDEYPKIGRAHV